MGRVSGCCGTDGCCISDYQPIFFEFSSWLSGFLLPLDLWSCFQSRIFLQLLFQGSGIFNDDRAMVLAASIRVHPLLMILFLLLSEVSSVLTNVTGQSYVACFGLTISASDAVRRVLFRGFMLPQFVLVLATLWKVP